MSTDGLDLGHDVPVEPEIGIQEPEADVAAQRLAVTPAEGPGVPSLGLEVPEADAIEQAHAVPDAEDEGREF